MNGEKIAWEDLKKIPHKEEVDPKVEFVAFYSPNTRSPSLILVYRSFNQHDVVAKMTGVARFNHKTSFSKREQVFAK